MKRSNSIKIGFIALALSLSIAQQSFGFEAEFHKLLAREAVGRSKLSTYLPENLGFDLEEEFRGLSFVVRQRFWEDPREETKSVRDWIVWGTWAEDNPMGPKAMTHYYDPTRRHHPQGRLNDIDIPDWVFLLLPDHWIPPEVSPESALERAYRSTGLYERPYSWVNAREYFYLALTKRYREERDWYFARTFRTLGQVLHLLEDMGSPAHVRNDNHVPVIWGKDFYEAYWTPARRLPAIVYPVVTFDRFEHFWDDDSGRGLAEFTNHNFLSRDTNFDAVKDYHKYDYPQHTDNWRTVEWELPLWVYLEHFPHLPRRVNVDYMIGTVRDNYLNATLPHPYLTARSYWDFEVRRYHPGKRVYSLNDTIHQAYGNLLIPRAVGYSAGLLNYFFRGRMGVEVSMLDDNTYQLIVTNKSEEKMDGGTLELYYDAVIEQADGSLRFERLPVEDSAGREITFSGITIEPGEKFHTSITFPRQTHPIARCILVYRGKIGEEESVSGKVFLLPLMKAQQPGIFLWSPCGTKIYLFSKFRDQLGHAFRHQIIDLKTQEETEIIRREPLEPVALLRWSPDGTKFAGDGCPPGD